MKNVQPQKSTNSLLGSDMLSLLQHGWADNPFHLYVDCKEPLEENQRCIIISQDNTEYVNTYIDEHFTYSHAQYLTSAIEILRTIQGFSCTESLSYIVSIYLFLAESRLSGSIIPRYKLEPRDKAKIFIKNPTKLSQAEIQAKKFPRASLSLNDLVDFWHKFGGYITSGIKHPEGSAAGRWWYGQFPPLWLSSDTKPPSDQRLIQLVKKPGVSNAPGVEAAHTPSLAEQLQAMCPAPSTPNVPATDYVELHTMMQQLRTLQQQLLQHNLLGQPSQAVSNPERPVEPHFAEGEKPNSIRCAGEYWLIIFQGESLPPLPNLVGMRCLKVLLTHPGHAFRPEDLYHLAHGNTVAQKQETARDFTDTEYTSHRDTSSGRCNVDDIMTPDTKRSVKKHLATLQEVMAEAEHRNDVERYDQAAQEQKEILGSYRKTQGLGGKSRRFPTPHDNARTNLQHAIKSARDKIEQKNKTLAHYLATFIKSGDLFTYTPDATNPLFWSCGDVAH